MNLSEKTEPDDAAAPRKRISWFAWVMAVLVAGCLLVMNSRGELDQFRAARCETVDLGLDSGHYLFVRFVSGTKTKFQLHI